MSNFEFIIAMIVVLLSIIGVVAGLIFLATKSSKRNAADKFVYISTTGKCYHVDPTCSGNEQKEAIKQSKAVKKGYSPCSRCCR